MKAVLMSIKPKWCEKIANGEKTIEVRKSRPKLETPFKVYIYCTNTPKYHHLYDLRPFDKSGKIKLGCVQHNSTSLVADNYINGKVIGEFVCDRIEYISPSYGYIDARCIGGTGYILDKCCLTGKELIEYGKGEPLYGWRITDLKIYDKPKELGEFKHDTILHTRFNGYKEPITRPPQSWCYVEVQND